MSFGNYEISAKLVIDNKNAKKALEETTKELAKLQKANDKVSASELKKGKYQDEIAKKTTANAKRTSNLYNEEYTNLKKLTTGINDNRLAHNNLGKEIEKHHNLLKSEKKTITESTKSWKEFANARGLSFSNGRLSTNLKDDALNIKNLGNVSTNAINEFSNSFNKYQSDLRKGLTTTTQFNQRVNSLSKEIGSKYGVSIRNAGKANYEFKNKTDGLIGSVNKLKSSIVNTSLRTSALGTMAGFVGGVLITDLAMGFSQARIQAVQFEQQSQQMLKTSKLTTGEINKLSNAIKKYTRENRKVNTQGLEYTVSQVTKLNNLSEKSAEKAIPVIADITNMMQLNGRTQEDAILAVNDALDGQFKRLQEIGVQGKEQLQGLGWTGKLESEKDVNSLLDALTKLGQRKGWSDLTKDISTLDDAYRVLGNTIDDFLTPIMVSITPTIVSVIEGVSRLIDVFTKLPTPIQGVISVLGLFGIGYAKYVINTVRKSEGAGNIVSRVFNKIKSDINTTKSTAESFGNSFISTFKNIPSTLKGFVASIGQAVISLFSFEATEVTVLGTTIALDVALGALVLSVAAVGVALAAITLAPLISQINQMHKDTKAYNKELENGNKKVQAFDDKYHQQLEAIRKNREESSYQIRKENGLLTEQEEINYRLYGSASRHVEKLQEELEIQSKLLAQANITEKRFSENKYTKNFAKDLAGWKDWEAQSFDDYVNSEDWLTTVQSGLAIGFARLGGWISVNFYDNVYTPIRGAWDRIKEAWNNFNLLELLGLNDVSLESITTQITTTLQTIIDTITHYLNPLNWFSNDGGAGIIQWWNINIADPLSGVLSVLGVDLHIGGQQAGQNLKNGLSSGSAGADIPVKKNLDPISWVIDKAKGIFGIKSNSAGQNIKSGIKKGSNGASSPVQSEMNDINKIISSQGGNNWFQTAANVASRIIAGIKAGLNRHSPGDAAKTVLAEMQDANMFMEEQGNVLHETAVNVGQKIVTGMSNVQGLGQSLNVINDNNAIMASTNEAQTYTSQQYGTMTNTVTNAFGVMSDTANTDMNNVAMKNATYLSQMNKDTQSNMTQIQTTTDGKLKTMQSTTVSATNSMSKAWASMRNNIVNSASQIRNLSYAKFSSLHRSISSFYRQLENAHFSSGLVAGVPTSNGKIVGKVGTNKKRGTIKSKTPNNIRKPVAGTPNNIRKPVAGTAEKNYNKIMNTAYPWKIADPWFLGIQLPMNNTVRDFNNGTATTSINSSNFENILTKILSARGFRDPSTYEFYWNSQKSNQQVWDSVGCNCYDGAEMIVEIAQMLGLGGHLVHGSWKGIGHMGAVVGGKLYDMTQFQKRGVFRGTPGVSFGVAGAPDKGKRVKWSTAGRGHFVGGGNNTTNNSNKKITVNVSGNNFIGLDDYKKQMESIAEDVFYDKMSVNPCIGI